MLSIKYVSRFEEWDKKSWIRSKPHQLDGFEEDLNFFTRACCPLFKHPAINSLDEETIKQILVHRLFYYLEFTVWLELGPVNDICNLIRTPDFLDWLPEKMKDDAYKLYADEAGHAEMSHALIRKIELYTGQKSLRIRPRFLEVLDSLTDGLSIEKANMMKLFFVIVSETLISSTLKDMPIDKSLQKAVREFAKDHAIDEGNHHNYFKQLFSMVWPKLSYSEQLEIGQKIPQMVIGFLYPDGNALTRILQQFPEQIPNPNLIIAEILSKDDIQTDINIAARATLNILKKGGLFKNEVIKHRFNEAYLMTA